MKVGTIILEFAEDLLRAYPPFVNFFENTKNKIQEVDKKNPRFHAFLKKCERRPECSRQSLTLRPVTNIPVQQRETRRNDTCLDYTPVNRGY